MYGGVVKEQQEVTRSHTLIAHMPQLLIHIVSVSLFHVHIHHCTTTVFIILRSLSPFPLIPPSLLFPFSLLPPALSYAALANLPPIQGLYAAIMPSATYVFLGTSMQLAVGPVAIVSLLTGKQIPLHPPGISCYFSCFKSCYHDHVVG